MSLITAQRYDSLLTVTASIWISKFTVSEFLKRLTSNIWRSSYETVLHCIRVFLVVTFIAVVIATLAECQPFDHYWQVMPDPGPQCRQGFAQLITMGAADIITDILLIAFPIPIIMASHFATGRKITLILLFSFSLALIAITATRVPEVISHHGRQQYRTVWASCEILASAFVSNAVIVGSFIRDKGVKRTKYRRDVGNDSLERTPTRRPTMARPDSDEDLFATIGCRLPRELYAEDNPPLDQPEVAYLRPSVSRQTEDRPPLASLKEGDDAPGERPSTSAEARSQTPQSSIEPLVRTQSRKSAHPDEDVELGDAGGLLGGDSPTVAASSQFSNQASSDTATSTADFASSAPSRRAARPSVMGLLSGRSAARRQSGPPPPVTPAPASAPLSQIRSGSTGGAAGPSPRAPPYRAGSHNTHLPMELKDVGGLIF